MSVEWVKLGNVVDVIRGASPRPKGDPRYFGGDIPWIMIADVTKQPGKYLSKTREGVTPEGSKKSRLLKAGTLILSNSGTVCVPKILAVDGCIHDGFVAFPNLPPTIDKTYLYHYFNFIRPRIIQENKQGVTQVNLNTNIVKEIDLPLRPLDEQQQIVAEIEKQFSRLDEAVTALKRIQSNLKRYKAAVLKAAVEGIEANYWKPIEQVIKSIGQGWSPQCENTAAIDSETWAVIKTTAVQPRAFLERENKILPQKLEPRPALEIQENDLLITRAGPRSRVGVTCLVKSCRPRLMICDKVYRISCKEHLVRPDFLELVLNTPDVIDALDELKTGISDSGVNLTQGRFNNLLVPLPSLPVQQTILEEIDRRLSVTEELEATIKTSLKSAERLRKVILQESFSAP